ncbi:hypothetical protein BDZ94DRAFT_1312503 [Collybia nuda]|uniref:Heterokaryon incompatibility domain-containing protein n=1 Tax=Collybia nuda TaxID=64659 RepID=A0A9P5XXA0_9AGAR|nr:hypothetical protein BDZ94DRAFT_1312503 [Collybia nuda]
MGSCIGTIRRPRTLTAIVPQPEVVNYRCSPEPVEGNIVQPTPPDNTLCTTLPSISEPISLTVPHFSPDKPPRPEFTPFTIPYLCRSNPYDGKGFWTFPERRGWVINVKDTNCHTLCPPGVCLDGLSYEDITEKHKEIQPPMLSRSDGSPVLASEKAAFLQAWVFFGFLAEISALCGMELDIKAEFTDDQELISTEKLNGLPGRWFKAVAKQHRIGDKPLMEHILRCVRQVVLMLTEESGPNFTQTFKYTYSECRILHSIDTAARVTALHLLLHLYSPGFSATDEEGWKQNRISNSVHWIVRKVEGLDQLSTFAEEDLEERGWCKSELELLASDDLAFASLLPRPNIKDHSGCERFICNAYQTDEAAYVTRHVEDGCGCNFVDVQTSALVNALSEGMIPKLVITGHLELEVVTEHTYPYVAVSHVWADGLGNPFSNALPSCQLHRLRGFINKLNRVSNPTSALNNLPIGLWMDTLCIPVEPNARAARKTAIQLLGKTFNEANAVLILDRELEIVESATASFFELGLRILCSGWVKRLWTLQEAALASEAHGAEKLYFQMRDGPFLYHKYDPNRKVSRPVKTTTEITAEERTILNDYHIMMELGAQIPSVHMMRNMREGWSPFQVIHSALAHRSTSKAEDVPVCIASLLGKDICTILSTEGVEQRMAKFYILMREIPCGVIWDTGPGKMSIRPFRWAPSSINACPEPQFNLKWNTGICDSLGLHVRYGGFVFAEIEERCCIGAMLPQEFNVAETGNALAKLYWPPAWARLQIQIQQNLAMILRQGSETDPLTPTAAVVIIEDTIQVDGGTEYVCRIVGYMHLLRANPDPETALFQGRRTELDQMWCIT